MGYESEADRKLERVRNNIKECMKDLSSIIGEHNEEYGDGYIMELSDCLRVFLELKSKVG